MLIEQYPVGWAVDAGNSEPVAVYLIDLPGVAMQGRTIQEAIDKLRAVVPEVLATYRKEGVPVPPPSAEPTMQIGQVSMTWFRPVSATRESTASAEVEIGADIQLVSA